MIVLILGLIAFSIVNALELYLAYKVGQGIKLSEAVDPVIAPIIKKVTKVVASVEPIHQNDVYEPGDEEYFENEQELEEAANRKIDEGLKDLKQIKQSHE